MAERPDALVAAVEPVVVALGLALYDVEMVGAGRGRTLRVSVERPGDGVDLGVISAVTEALSPALDRVEDPAVEAVLRAPYVLEVSSPGLERVLRRPEHFRGAVGTVISVKHRADDGVARRDRGTLAAAGDDGIDLATESGTVSVRYDQMVQARTVFEWGTAAKPDTKKSETKRGRAKQKAAS